MRKIVSLIALLLVMWMTSCMTREKLIYLQGADSLAVHAEKIAQNYTLKIQNDDMLSIKVGTSHKELLEPLGNNLFLGQVGATTNATTNSQKTNYYLVDHDGYVNLPIFGKMKVAGETCMELEKKLVEKFKEKGYAYDPIVSVKIMNFKVSVLGDVVRPGDISVEGDRITILEALAKVGDLQSSGLRKNVLVVREENGIRTTGRVDLTSANILESPFYYLKQNDLIYVEANSSISVKGSPFFSFWSAGSSILSVVISIVSLITVISK